MLENPPLEFVDFVSGVVEMREEMLVWIETEELLKEMVEVLSKERVFAVDTEQHSFRSFLGFTALIQVYIFLCHPLLLLV